MSVAGNQQRTFLRLLAALRPHWHRDQNLPARIQQLLARERSFGSRDRRLYRELIYTTLRHLPWIEPQLDTAPDEAVRRVAWLAAETPATRAFRESFATGEAPKGDRAELLPAWFREHCPEIFSGEELTAQLRRAPLWIRVQRDSERVFAEFEQRGWKWSATEATPHAFRVHDEVDLTKTESFAAGNFEVQDLGSQLVLEIALNEPSGVWLDACAGAGGKTLQLAHLLGDRGRVEAYDVRTAALDELQRRATRAALRNVSIRTEARLGTYDGVIVDAPCSGSGTWRRSPHLKWTTTSARIREAAALQLTLLREHAARVAPGGRLIYATCSLSRRENEDVVAAFLAENPEFATETPAKDLGFPLRGGGTTIWPSRWDTDGFFVAVFRRR
ncbi:MAG: RsmB/NOP family class I SAM-dependent RNA methyltransferase [Opitutus sp.]|nr:RsmB/NOP family class I SAM-dependent RNA methyltransferase [Opitutus sp.]